MTIAHIINPVKVPESSDLFIAQPVTFESMRKAVDFVKEELTVDLYAVCYEEDLEVIPTYFKALPLLERSVLDVASFNHSRKLPLIVDILNRAEDLDADYLVYTNVDIALMPHFYSAIADYIDKGFDAIAINRKTISADFTSADQLPQMYAQKGARHEGIDTFVFKKEWLNDFYWGGSIIGSGPVGLAFCVNMIAKANKFIWLEEPDLTFHLGDDKAWTDPQQMDYIDYSYHALNNIAEFLQKKYAVDDKFNLLATTRYFCRDVLANRDVPSKFGSIHKPKRIIAQISAQSPSKDQLLKNIFIYGSGRSGTSMLAGLFSECGYHMGESLYPSRDTNPKGFFESAEINGLNEQLIAHNITKPFLFKNYNQKLKESQRWLASFSLDKTFGSNQVLGELIKQETEKGPFCYKDPRFSYTYPLWKPFAGDHVCLVIYRSPGKTITSMQKEIATQPYLKGCSNDTTRLMELWCNLYERIIQRDTGTAMFIHYDQVFQADKLEELKAFTGVQKLTSFAERRFDRSTANIKLDARAESVYSKLNQLARFHDE